MTSRMCLKVGFTEIRLVARCTSIRPLVTLEECTLLGRKWATLPLRYVTVGALLDGRVWCIPLCILSTRTCMTLASGLPTQRGHPQRPLHLLHSYCPLPSWCHPPPPPPMRNNDLNLSDWFPKTPATPYVCSRQHLQDGLIQSPLLCLPPEGMTCLPS